MKPNNEYRLKIEHPVLGVSYTPFESLDYNGGCNLLNAIKANLIGESAYVSYNDFDEVNKINKVVFIPSIVLSESILSVEERTV